MARIAVLFLSSLILLSPMAWAGETTSSKDSPTQGIIKPLPDSPETSPATGESDKAPANDTAEKSAVQLKTAQFTLDLIPGMVFDYGDKDATISLGLLAAHTGALHGIQLAPLSSSTTGEAHGLQIGGLVAASGSSMDGVQLGGLVSVAGNDMEGLQIAGLVGVIGGTQKGIQVALVNYAKRVEGLQVGLINISDEMAGFPVGLVNVSNNGIREVSTSLDSMGRMRLAARLGTPWTYTSIHVESDPGRLFSWGPDQLGINQGLRLGNGDARSPGLFLEAEAGFKLHLVRMAYDISGVESLYLEDQSRTDIGYSWLCGVDLQISTGLVLESGVSLFVGWGVGTYDLYDLRHVREHNIPVPLATVFGEWDNQAYASRWFFGISL